MPLNFKDARALVIRALAGQFEGFDPASLVEDSTDDDEDRRKGFRFTHVEGDHEAPQSGLLWALPWDAALDGVVNGVWRGLGTERRRVRVAGVSLVPMDARDASEVESIYDRSTVAGQLGLVLQGRQFAAIRR